MRKLLSRRPSPALLIAFAALVMSLAGTAVAANNFTSKHIKNGSLTGADVKNDSLSSPDFKNGGVFSADIGAGQVHTDDLGDDAVRGDKIQSNTIDGSDVIDDTLGGREINEGSLGKVASAARADKAGDADTLGGLGPDAFLRKGEAREQGGGGSAGYVARYFGNGEEVTLAEGGGLRVYATCEIGGYDIVRLFVDSTADDAAYDDNNGPEDSDFDASEGPDELYIEDADGDPNIEATNYGGGVTAVAADGSVIAVNNYALGVNLPGRADACFVSGSAISVKAS